MRRSRRRRCLRQRSSLLTSLQGRGRDRGLAVVFVSSHDMFDAAAVAARREKHAHVVKPFGRHLRAKTGPTNRLC